MTALLCLVTHEGRWPSGKCSSIHLLPYRCRRSTNAGKLAVTKHSSVPNDGSCSPWWAMCITWPTQRRLGLTRWLPGKPSPAKHCRTCAIAHGKRRRTFSNSASSKYLKKAALFHWPAVKISANVAPDLQRSCI